MLHALGMWKCLVCHVRRRYIRTLTTVPVTEPIELSGLIEKTGTMSRVLNVAEKNDAAKSLADLMSGGRYNKREGFSVYNKIYEYPYNIFNRNCTMTMTSVSGHLLGYEFTGQYKKWFGCNPVALFDAPLEKFCPENFVNIKRTLEREIRGCQTLIIWTDCDREGENIGYEVIQVCRAVKPGIQVFRARFSEITPQAVTRAINNLEPPDQNTSDAVDVRQELDLRIGASFTRFQTLRLKQVFPDVLADQLISYGSCQFPTLGFVVERYKQVQAFIAEPFWKLLVTYESVDDGIVEFTWKRHRLFDHLACLVLYQHCLDRPLATVVDVVSKPKSKWRPVALDTVEMEKISSRKLRIGAKETMKIAEKLYTQGFISYPRTETNMFPKDFDLATLIGHQTNDPNWGAFAANILNVGPTPRNGSKTDKAHPPIHPLKYTDSLQGNDRVVYEFVVRHFLACCSQDAQGQETTVEIDVNDERFSVSGLMIIARNYLDVYPYDKWNSKTIPRLVAGETFQPKSIEMNQGETSPPSLLTEADLITLMEKHGIGTDATHAEHIETIKARLYVGVQPDGKFVPGELGMGLVEGYDAMGFEMSKPYLRAELEADLKRICEGQKDKDVVLREQIQKYREVFMEAVRQASKIDEALSQFFGNPQPAPVLEQIATAIPVCLCPLCNQEMIIKSKKDNLGLYVSCMGYPDCRSAVWFPTGVLEASVSDEICDICLPGPRRKIRFKFKRGSMPAYIPLEYVACIGGCDDDFNVALDIRFPRPSVHQATPASRNVSRDSGYSGSTYGGNNSGSTGSHNSGSTGGHNSGFTSGQNSGSTSGHNSGSTGGTASYLQTRVPRLTPTTQPTVPVRVTPTIRPAGPLSLVDGIRPNFLQPMPPAHMGNTANRPGFMAAGNAKANGSGHDRTQGGGATGANNVVVCHCAEDAKLLTVRKDGVNNGRQFYSCSKPRESSCGFFLWADLDDNADDQNTANRNPNAGGQTQQYRNPPSTNSGGGGAGFPPGGSGGWPRQRGGETGNEQPEGEVKCGCGNNAKQLTVQKEGVNKGRLFYGCSKPMNQGCGFFLWADDQNAAGGQTNTYASGGAGSRYQSNTSNRGGASTSNRGGGGGSAANVGNDAAKKKRKCGLCGQEGHTRKSCKS